MFYPKLSHELAPFDWQVLLKLTRAKRCLSIDAYSDADYVDMYGYKRPNHPVVVS